MGTRIASTPAMSRGITITLAAVVAALALGLTGACGGGDQADGDRGNGNPSEGDRSEGERSEGERSDGDRTKKEADAKPPAMASATPRSRPTPRPDPTGIGAADGKVLSQGELDRAVLADGDVPGFTVRPMDGPPAGGESADVADCVPLTAVINGKPEPLGKAVAYRQIVGPEDDRPAVSEFLTTHGTQGARNLLSRLRTAATACADGFTASGGGSPRSTRA
nr:hypothetical protein OH820_22900 [Streptomyces sp. NBC_00857]